MEQESNLQAEPVRPPEAPGPKTADRPHRWTVILSFAALCISGTAVFIAFLALREARQNTRINEESARAHMRVTSVFADFRALQKHLNPRFRTVPVYLTISNAGRTAAKHVRVEYALITVDHGPPITGSRGTPNTRADGAIGRAAQFSEFGPNSAEVLRFGVPVRFDRDWVKRPNSQLNLAIDLIFKDGLHARDEMTSGTYCGRIPMKSQRELVQFHYCVNEILRYDQESGRRIDP